MRMSVIGNDQKSRKHTQGDENDDDGFESLL